MKLLFILILLFSCTTSFSQEHRISIEDCQMPFYHGVASGDPLSNKVIIWTRVTPEADQMDQSLTVYWRVATDTAMTDVVRNGVVSTDMNSDFTVKVDVPGLTPNTLYFYEFQTGEFLSPRGRTRTAPVGVSVDSLRFALVSCANFEAGYFSVYNSLLEREDFDAVIVLGDYIYEYETGGFWTNPAVERQWQPDHEIISIADYRMRYSSYKLDTDLQRLHQQFPFIVIYDDHEFANNSWMGGADNHQPEEEGLWSNRKAMAQQAFFEWLPIRPNNSENPYQIYRNIKYGNLVELMMLDTRIEGRDEQAGTTSAAVEDTTRQLLGTIQLDWLKNKLDSSGARWKVLGQQVMMAPLKIFGVGFSGDQWDGYPAERNRIYRHVLNNNIYNMVVITGDIHSSWACDLPTENYNSLTGEGSAGVEFVTPSVTAPSAPIPLLTPAILAANSHIKYCDISSHGYVILDINKQRAQADWFNITTIDNSPSTYNYAASFYVNNLHRHLIEADSYSLPRAGVFNVRAPLCPRIPLATNIGMYTQKPVILSVYPNPAESYMTVQLFQRIDSDLRFSIYDLSGKLISEDKIENVQDGVSRLLVDTSNIAAGSYLLSIDVAGSTQTIRFTRQ